MNVLSQFVHHHQKWIMPVLTAASALAGAYLGNSFQGTFEFSHLNLLCIVVIILLAVIQYITAIANEHYKVVIKKLGECEKRYMALFDNIQTAIDGLSIQASNNLEFHLQEKKIDRLTVYSYTEGGFFALSRRSENPLYSFIRKEQVYPIEEGCIGKGWEHGWWFESELPCPKTQLTSYREVNGSKYGLRKSRVTKLRMKSRLFAVSRVQKDGKLLGVVVLESEDKDRFLEENSKVVLELLSSQIAPLLLGLNEHMEHVPRITV